MLSKSDPHDGSLAAFPDTLFALLLVSFVFVATRMWVTCTSHTGPIKRHSSSPNPFDVIFCSLGFQLGVPVGLLNKIVTLHPVPWHQSVYTHGFVLESWIGKKRDHGYYYTPANRGTKASYPLPAMQSESPDASTQQVLRIQRSRFCVIHNSCSYRQYRKRFRTQVEQV